MRTPTQSIVRFAPLVALVATSVGCLSLGGKTTYMSESPETSGRLSALESRVSTLEQALNIVPPPQPTANVVPKSAPAASSF